jgi:hypothetical protein
LPTFSPTPVPSNSNAMRFEMSTAASARGCVQRTSPSKFSAAYCGSCVVLPLLVAPTTIICLCSRKCVTNSSLARKIGRACSSRSMRRCSGDFRCATAASAAFCASQPSG